MKAIILHTILGLSLVAAVILGVIGLRTLYLVMSSHPEEFTFFRAPVFTSIRSLLTTIAPLALYASVFIASRDLAWSRFGRVVFFVQVAYILTVISQWVYVYRLSLAFDRNA